MKQTRRVKIKDTVKNIKTSQIIVNTRKFITEVKVVPR